MGMEPIMAIWAGFSLNDQSVAENQLAPFIQTARDQIDFVIGDSRTNAMGKLFLDFC
jgi:alpha-N-arabinofuranosidase